MAYKKLDHDGLQLFIMGTKKYIDDLLDSELTFEEYYKYLMKEFFEKRGSKTATPEQLTAICDEWYMYIRPKWDGYTKFYHPDKSAVSTGIKGGDNLNMICEPSTNTYKGRDDYADNPLFIPTDCNWEMSSNGEPLITSIDGITCAILFVRNDPNKFVGVLQMTGYHWWTELSTDDNYYYEGYCSRYTSKHGMNIEALPEAVIHEDVDVTNRTLLESISNGSRCNVRSWVLHSKYMSDLTSNNTMTSYSGSPTRTYVFSHNSSHTYANNTSVTHGQSYTYSGSTICDNAFLILMMRIKYASLTMDNIIKGCVNYSFQYAAVVSETNTKRVIISAANAENIIIGSTMLVGTYQGGINRGTSTSYNISGQSGFVVTGKVYVGDNVAIVFNNAPNTFTSTGNTTATTNGTTYISSFPWYTGSCDNILGNDGSPFNCVSGTDPAKLQGIEYMIGAYEVFADVILNLYQSGSEYYYQPYIVHSVANQAESITSNYVASGLTIAQPATTGWNYIVHIGYKNGIYFPTRVGGSSTTYTCDAFYMSSKTTGIMQYPSYAMLWDNYYAGISCLYCSNSIDYWNFATRLSCNGNKGVYIH